MKNFSVIVLAAGEGRRMKSTLPKVLHELGGRPLIYYVLRELLKLKRYVKEIVIVLGHQGRLVEKEVGTFFSTKSLNPIHRNKVRFVEQSEMLGTAHAVKIANKSIKSKNVLVVCADAPLITAKSLTAFISFYLRRKLSCCVLTANVKGKNSLGVVVYDKGGRIKAIKEKIGFPPLVKEGALCEVNSGMYCFERNILSRNLPGIKKNRKKQEYFLTDIVEILYENKSKPGSYLLNDSSQILGINTQGDLCAAEEVMRKRVLDEFMERGVKIIDSQTTFIQEGVKIGKNCLIYPFTFIEKGVIIGNNCSLGPFVHLRKGSSIGNHTDVGNFLEINRTRIGKDVKIKHFGYLGDTIIEDKVNIGAGTVVANFDGKSKNKTYIRKGAFIGCDTVLVAPVKIGKKAVTGAGSVITKDVKPGTTVVGIPARALKRTDSRKQKI